MKQKEIHFFDLDGTLISAAESKIWVVDKESPHVPILKIPMSEYHLIENGIYKSNNLVIDYNGSQYSISKDIMERVKKAKGINDINRLGLSFVEFYSDEYINNSKIKFLTENIRHLADTESLVCILTGRAHRDRHGNLQIGRAHV